MTIAVVALNRANGIASMQCMNNLGLLVVPRSACDGRSVLFSTCIPTMLLVSVGVAEALLLLLLAGSFIMLR